MPPYTCEDCNKEFKQKSHYDKHKARKKPCKKKHSHISKRCEIKPLSWFHDNMQDIFNFVVNQLDPAVKRGERKITVCAEVKTGKRFIAQVHALYNSSISGGSCAHFFTSAFIRRDDDRQRREINEYFRGTNNDQRVFKINTEKSVHNCIRTLREYNDKYDKVIVHHDELDYGSGNEQHMSAVYEYCISQEKICLISYSATYEEAMVDDYITNLSNTNPLKLTFVPPEEYRGVKWYCENNLVEEAMPFFEKQNDTIVISEQAKKILRETEENVSREDPEKSRKKLLIVRVNLSFEEVKEMIDSDVFPELRCREDIRILPEFIHSRKELNTMTVKWDDYEWWRKHMEISRGSGKFIEIIFIDQCSTRSTDWFCHPWLSAYHDYHPNPSVSCSGQSNPRPVYYTNKMCNGVRVYNNQEFYPKLYGQKNIIEYMAGLIPLSKLNVPVSSRSDIYLNIHTFGFPIKINFNNEELENNKDYFNTILNDNSRNILDTVIHSKLHEALSRMKPQDRNKFESGFRRILKGKRVYTKDSSKQGGVYSVASNYLRGLNSRPGGGVGEIGGDVYNDRGKYYWIDVVMEDLEFEIKKEKQTITKGTVFVTYGIPDPEPVSDLSSDDDEDDNEEEGEVTYVHKRTNKSMFYKS